MHARTDGNAFFVEEVLRGLAESGPRAVPESVRHAVGVRLSRMGDEANELIAAAAILGPGARRSRAAGHRRTRAGRRRGSARRDPARAAPAPHANPHRFEFTHALVREAVLDECNVLRRARLHRRGRRRSDRVWARTAISRRSRCTCSRRRPPPTRDGRPRCSRAPVDRALDRLAYEDAAERFERALEALELAGAEDESGPVLLARGDALLRAGEPDEARAAFSTQPGRWRCAKPTTTSCSPERRSVSPGWASPSVDLDAEAIARLEEALDRVEDAALRSRVQARLAVELYYAPDRTRSETLSAEAVATARAGGRRERARRRPRRAARGAVAPRPRRGAIWPSPDEMIAAAPRGRRPARRAAGSQLARHGSLRARRHGGLA